MPVAAGNYLLSLSTPAKTSGQISAIGERGELIPRALGTEEITDLSIEWNTRAFRMESQSMYSSDICSIIAYFPVRRV